MIGTTILIDTVTPVINAFNALPSPIGKKYYQEQYYQENELIKEAIYEDEDKICLTVNTFMILYNTKFIPLKRKTSGLTYDKHTHKIKLWLGSKIESLPIPKFFKYLGIDWVENMSKSLHYKNINVKKLFKTKTVLEKIINGKITNPKKLIQCFLKTSVKYKFHWKLARTFLNYNNYTSLSGNHSNFLIQLSKYTINPNESLKLFLHLYDKKEELTQSRRTNTPILENFWDGFPLPSLISNNIEQSERNILNHIQFLCFTLKNYNFLEEKMNFKWSTKRLMRELEKTNHYLKTYEAMCKDCTSIPYVGELRLPLDTKLITSENMCYNENILIGESLSYKWDNIFHRKIFAISFVIENRKFVAIVNKRREEYNVTEILSQNREHITENIKNNIVSWCINPEAVAFYSANESITTIVDEPRNDDNDEPLDIF